MKRSELFLKIWRDCHGILKPAARVAIIGGGTSGLHLAHALVEQKFSVTVFEPRRCGGVRIPLMHACHTLKVRAPLWEHAAAFARGWYAGCVADGDAIEQKNEFGSYFILRARSYLRHLQRRLVLRGVEFVAEAIVSNNENLPGFDLTCIATGAATTALTATRIVSGWESYFSRFGSPALEANIGKNGDKITNYMHLPSRAGFIHRNGESRTAAENFARAVHPTGRRALFQGERLTTRDRFPVVGFLNAAPSSPFLFCAMGYHAMTYAPYLAHAAAIHLAGGDAADENLISTLTPARFLPRV